MRLSNSQDNGSKGGNQLQNYFVYEFSKAASDIHSSGWVKNLQGVV